jgi:hypothetical protein
MAIAMRTKENEYFCDLQCHGCGALRLQACIMVSQRVNMITAMVTCMANHLLLEEFAPPGGFWANNLMLSPETMPEVTEFPQYVGETEN